MMNEPPRFKRPLHPRGEDDELLTLVQVSELTGIPVNTLRWMRANDRGPRSFRLGRGVRFWLSDVLAWIDAQYENGDPRAS